jgi:hypothetical protein
MIDGLFEMLGNAAAKVTIENKLKAILGACSF